MTIDTQINSFNDDLAKEVKILRDRIELGVASEAEYKRYHELINLAGIKDNFIKSKLEPYHMGNIEEYYSRKKTEKDDNKLLGVILGLGLAALFIWSISDNKKK